METHKAIAQLDDLQLLEQLCSKEDDILYYEQFVQRFLPEIKEECKRICNARKLDQHIGLQISHETFERVRKYKSFKKEEIKLPNQHKAIIVYLIRISIRLFNDYYRKDKICIINHKTYFDEILEQVKSPVDLKALKEKKDIAIFIFNKLNENEKKVVLLDIQYKKHQKYLPDDVTESLANEMNVLKDTIRKIRKRAIAKIIKAIDEINQN